MKHVPDWQTATIADLCAPLSAKVQPRSLSWDYASTAIRNTPNETAKNGAILQRIRKKRRAAKHG